MSEKASGEADSCTDNSDKEVPLYRNREWLVENYVESDLPVSELADKAGCCKSVLYKYIRKFNIQNRRSGNYGDTSDAKYRDKDWLETKYCDESLSTGEIGDICDCSKQTIGRWLENHGIEKRSRSDAAEIRAKRYPNTWGTENIRDYNWWSEATQEEKEDFRQWLSEQRQGDDNPMSDITGPDHHNYKENPTSSRFYQSAKWKNTREQVLERDNQQCQVCGKTGNLDVHHINPIANGGAKFDLENLISLCNKHHKLWEGLYLRPDTHRSE